MTNTGIGKKLNAIPNLVMTGRGYASKEEEKFPCPRCNKRVGLVGKKADIAYNKLRLSQKGELESRLLTSVRFATVAFTHIGL